jgi:hypothetical protein
MRNEHDETTESHIGLWQADLKGGTEALEGDGPYTVSGVALGEYDETRSANGSKVWTPAALEAAADTLADDSRNRDYPGDGLAVVNHSESARDVVGEVTDSGYVPGLGVAFEADIEDEQMARNIAAGRLEVSPRTIHTHDDLLEETEDGKKAVNEGDLKRLVHLSAEQAGESPSNYVQAGPSEELADRTAATDMSASIDRGERVVTDGSGTGGESGSSEQGGTDYSVEDDPRFIRGDLRSNQERKNMDDLNAEERKVVQQFRSYDDPRVVEEAELNDLRSDNDDLQSKVDDLEDEKESLQDDLKAVRKPIAEQLSDMSGLSEDTILKLDDEEFEDMQRRQFEREDVDTTDLRSVSYLSPKGGDPGNEGGSGGGGGGNTQGTDLGAGPNGEGGGGGSPDEYDEETIDMAAKRLDLSETMRVQESDMNAAEFVAEEKGVDPSKYNSETDLRAAIASAENEQTTDVGSAD